MVTMLDKTRRATFLIFTSYSCFLTTWNIATHNSDRSVLYLGSLQVAVKNI